MKTYLQCAFREFRHRKARTAVTIAGYTVVTAIVVSMVTWMGLSRTATDEVLANVGAHFIGYIPREASSDEPVAIDPVEGFVTVGMLTEPFPYSYIEEIDRHPAVWQASPYLSFRIREDDRFFLIGGFDPSKDISVNGTVCSARDVVEGRYLEQSDRHSAMVEQSYAVANYISLGDMISIGDFDLEIIGVVDPVVRPAKADIYLHIDDARRIIETRVRPGALPAGAANTVLVEARTAHTMDTAMSGLGAVDPGFRAFGFGCWRPAARAMGLGESAVGLLVGVMMAALFLFAGKSQFASVVEREHDIGILSVVGWSKKNVIAQIVIESVMVALGGSFIGFIIGALVVYFVPLQTVIDFPLMVNVVVSPTLLLVVLMVALAGGALAGVFPALVAAGRSPAESIRRL